MSRQIERIAYYSRSQVSMDSLLLIADILAVSQRNNRRDNITGALLYNEGVFFQVVEGAPCRPRSPASSAGIRSSPQRYPRH